MQPTVVHDFLFIFSLSLPLSSVAFWRFLLTGADFNSEIKLWCTVSWKCLQVVRFLTPDPQPCLKVCLDQSASFLMATDMKRKVKLKKNIYLYIIVIQPILRLCRSEFYCLLFIFSALLLMYLFIYILIWFICTKGFLCTKPIPRHTQGAITLQLSVRVCTQRTNAQFLRSDCGTDKKQTRRGGRWWRSSVIRYSWWIIDYWLMIKI